MDKPNPLAGLIGYGDSDEDSDDGGGVSAKGGYNPAVAPGMLATGVQVAANASATIHPAPIAHCPWSACYDEGSGFTYYWNQNTNEVTWEAPREYLLALKVAKQHIQTAGTAEVSAAEWQLYQQALADKSSAKAKVPVTPVAPKPTTVVQKQGAKDLKYAKKRPLGFTPDDDEKIELITSYHNTDSESNDESDSSVKPASPEPTNPVTKPSRLRSKPKKQKKTALVQFGPSLPSNQEYSVPIGPELPPVSVKATPKPSAALNKVKSVTTTLKSSNFEGQDEKDLLLKLKDKAKILEKLGGQLPSDVQKIIEKEKTTLTSSSPKNLEMEVDSLLAEIEQKELPKIKAQPKQKVDIFENDMQTLSKEISTQNSPKSLGDKTPPLEELKPLFPSSTAKDTETVSLFPSSVNINGAAAKTIETHAIDTNEKPMKKPNIYLTSEPMEKVGRKKLRISNSVLPERKKCETPSYTTKYSQHIEGFSSERTGLGFSKEHEEDKIAKSANIVKYGKGLTFTKGEVLNEDRKDEALDDLMDLLEAKLGFLNQLQPFIVPPVTEMTIQMQTLVAAFRGGALSASYWQRWLTAAATALARLEASAAPQGWTCTFSRSEGRYRYRRTADGLEQWEYPAAVATDMDICTTPPHVNTEMDYTPTPPLVAAPTPPLQPPLPTCSPPPPPPPPPQPPPPCISTPPPPEWPADPPPPGIDDVVPLPPPPPAFVTPWPQPVAVQRDAWQPEQPKVPKQEIGDELMSFYSEINELDKVPARTEPEPKTPPQPPVVTTPLPVIVKEKTIAKIDKQVEEKLDGKAKKKSKVKISSSVGMKHKSVSHMVAKWQQVAEEINYD